MRTCNVCLENINDNEFRKDRARCKKCVYQKYKQLHKEKMKNKLFMIYRLHIDGTTIYIGKTKNMKERYRAHYKICYNSNAKKGYNSKLYLTIRQLNISKEQFKDFVKYEILYENIPEGYEKIMENLVIKLYRDNGVNLLNELNGLIDEDKLERNRQINIENHRKEAVIRAQKHYEKNKEKILEQRKSKEYRDKANQKIKCDLCNIEMSKKSLNRHKKRKH